MFLDIDGPIINTPCYYIDGFCSIKRTVMNTQAIGYVMRLAELANAYVVCNSTHNTHDIDDPLTGNKRDLKTDLIYWGMKPEVFHKDWRTTYPYPDGMKMSGHPEGHPRMVAINHWLKKNGDYDWIAFDDDWFTKEKNLILIDFDLGIDKKAFEKAKSFWNIKESELV